MNAADFTTESVSCYLGDCLNVLPKLQSVDICIADPPYGIDYQSARRTNKTKWKPKIVNDMQPFIWWLQNAFSILRDPGALLCFCRWDVQEAFRLAIGWAGFDLRSQIVWDRLMHGTGDLNGTPAPRHDIIWFGTKGRFRFHGKRPHSVIQEQRIPGDQLIHPNQKPIRLIERLIERYTKPGDVVLDPFMGSGTTGMAAIRMRRRFIGIEIDEKYFTLAIKRIREAGEDLPILEIHNQLDFLEHDGKSGAR